MGLTVTQKSIINKAQAVGGSKQGVALDDEQCAYLVAVVATDLRVRGKLRLGKVRLPLFSEQLHWILSVCQELISCTCLRNWSNGIRTPTPTLIVLLPCIRPG